MTELERYQEMYRAERSHRQRLQKENSELRRRLVQVEHNASMACENAPENCVCSGCMIAAEYYS